MADNKKDVWQELDEVVDAVLAMPPEAAIEEREESGEPELPDADYDDS